MAEGSSGNDLQRILEAIKSSEVVENRVQLLAELGNMEFKDIPNFGSLVGYLTTFWEDFTCLDVSQCMLNRSIIQVALKYVEFDLSNCLPQILTFGIKASIWCGKHLKMTLLSTQDSQEEEHSSMFHQLLQDILRFSASTISALMKFPISGDKALMDKLHNFILELLNLARDSISEFKKIQSFGPELLKVTQYAIDAVIKLCKVFSESVNWENFNENPLSVEVPYSVDHVINITNCAVEKLSQIGVLAANDGGNSVSILNVSWKGVVSLLQIGRGILAEKVNIANVVVTLLSLVNEPLKCAVEAWSSSQKDTISITEAKRIFVPVKFYLINAIKICSLYPCQAYTVYKEIALCVLVITTFRIALCNESCLKSACAVCTELLGQASLDLVISFLNSNKMKLEQKTEVLEWLFVKEGDSYSHLDSPTITDFNLSLMHGVFRICCEGMSQTRILGIGRVALFIDFLRCSILLDEEARVGINRKLPWLLDILIVEDVYSCMLILHLPFLNSSGKATELIWQPLFATLLHALKTFMIVVSSSAAWGDLESFLLENLFHPHFLCWELVMECWCFMLRHAETEMANGIISKLCSLLRLLASSESVLLPNSCLRKLARSICLLLTYGAQSLVDQVYMSVIGDSTSRLSSVLCLALFIEGFPLDLLSDDLRTSAINKIISDYLNFIDNFDGTSSVACSSDPFGIPVFILSASLQSFKVILSDIDARTLKFLNSVIRNYKSSVDEVTKDQYLQLLGETLGTISSLEHLYASNDIERVILELQNIFISGPVASDPLLYKCKANLSHFMAGLIHVEMSEKEDDPRSCAVWELYHMLLKERHWALVHLAMTAFGHYAHHTKCGKLWRFVPEDAALAYDVTSAVEINKDRFMLEFKAFLDKELALLTNAPSSEQLELLGREALVLKNMVHKMLVIAERGLECESMAIDDTNQLKRKRKLPDEISRGVELLKNGLKIIGDGLSQWQLDQLQTNELHSMFLTQFSQLENVITHFEGLARSSEAGS